MALTSCSECNQSIMESRTLLKESQIMKIHYITGIAAIFVVALHIMMRLVVPFELSLEYDYIIANYKNLVYVLILESILVLISVHGFNGVRIILLETETKQGLGKHGYCCDNFSYDSTDCIWD